jgi:hypothetical protein
MDRAARAAAAAAAVAEQAELGDQPQTPSDQIAYRVRRLASRPRSSTTTPVAPSTTSTTPASTAPPPAPVSAPPIPPARFWECDETEVRPLAADPRLFDLQRATAARVHRFRYVPMESWLPAQRDPAVVDLFSTRIQESFFRAQMSAQIAPRVHRLLDLPAFLLAAGADSEVHLSYLSGLLTLMTTSDRYVEEWVRVFYATVWIDPDHHWMRFRLSARMSLLLPARFASSLVFTSRRLDFTTYATTPLTLLIALTAVWLRVQLTSRLCSDRPSQMGRDAHQQISLQQQSSYFSL